MALGFQWQCRWKKALGSRRGNIVAGHCVNAGWSRADVHSHLCELAGRKVRDLKGGGNWRRERALALPIDVDPDDDDCFIPAIKNSEDLQLIVAGGWDPCTAVCHGCDAAAGDGFGNGGTTYGDSVALSDDGNTLAVGALLERSASSGVNGDRDDYSLYGAGAVYVFTRGDSGWTELPE